MSAVEADGVATRDPDLILARLHLRLGSLALARAELETLAGRDALDADGLVDLAEARWRTGDIAGAGARSSPSSSRPRRRPPADVRPRHDGWPIRR